MPVNYEILLALFFFFFFFSSPPPHILPRNPQHGKNAEIQRGSKKPQSVLIFSSGSCLLGSKPRMRFKLNDTCGNE